MLLNDEAHHDHDEKLALSRVIAGIHERLVVRGLPGLVAQLDFTATPKSNDGALFEQILADYPLADAIAAGECRGHPLVLRRERPPRGACADGALRDTRRINQTLPLAGGDEGA